MTPPHCLKLIRSRRQTDPVIPPADATPRLPQIQGIRAIVFDVYGTLFSSAVGDISLATEENRDAAIRTVLSDNHIQVVKPSETLRLDEALHAIIHRHQDKRRDEGIEYPEVEIRSVWSDLIEELSTTGVIELKKPVDIESIVIDYETRVNLMQPMPDLAKVLAELRARGMVLSIISNAQFYTPLLFEAFLKETIDELGFCPSCNVWSYAELEGKPSQSLYQIAAKRLKKHHGLRPEQCLYIGNDMRNDIWPAQALAFRTALFSGDHLSLRLRKDHPSCKNLMPDAEITALPQVLQIIDP